MVHKPTDLFKILSFKNSKFIAYKINIIFHIISNHKSFFFFGKKKVFHQIKKSFLKRTKDFSTNINIYKKKKNIQPFESRHIFLRYQWHVFIRYTHHLLPQHIMFRFIPNQWIYTL